MGTELVPKRRKTFISLRGYLPKKISLNSKLHCNNINFFEFVLVILSPVLFNLYSDCLIKEALDGLGDFNIGGQIIQTVKYGDDLVLMAKEETVLQVMIDKLNEIGR